ncbi:hypothetical protein BJV77DRAFT_522193 [Russula vinacea]|nr:hypothetical protein BJV77DRAFT_522193 [Russula vinacea]
MTVYVKGFKIDRQKVPTWLEYQEIVGGYEEPGPDGHRPLALIIALEFGEDKEKLRAKKLGPIDESIRFALPHTLVGPGVWELFD